ncbi:hypothetical protein SAY86_013614 [Trapa natans]|uniref:Late embryogenesis abundant protein LEA-2 subgroup domain-containing protein n=1 Tax=Trapa natans TaxID=22666 RepID=A0AAN7KUW7_TRANT|nr:hypothetical protein SAY86_013614 [Trapa natans]
MMADHQRIHPVWDPEAASPQKSTAPLVNRENTRSEKGKPVEYPSFRRTIPVVHSKPPKRRCTFCRFLCWTLALFVFLVVALAATLGILYLVFRPKVPKYSVDGLEITRFNLGNDNSLSATFDVNITAKNPNDKIGIYYEGGSWISVWYTGSKLAEGALPKFYQGHRNTTVLVVPMTGETKNATGLIASLQLQRQQSSVIPLDLIVRQPVRVKLGMLKLPKVKLILRCNINVDSLSSQNIIRIKNNNCKKKVRL